MNNDKKFSIASAIDEQKAYDKTCSIWLTAHTPEREGFAFRDGHNAGWKNAESVFGGSIKRLTSVIKTANEQAEQFEREWYLRGDEIERLRTLCDDLYSDILAAASLAPKDCGAYSLLHETIRLRRERWARMETHNVK